MIESNPSEAPMAAIKSSVAVKASVVALAACVIVASAVRAGGAAPFDSEANRCNGRLLTGCQTCVCTSDEDDLPDLDVGRRSANGVCRIVSVPKFTPCSDANSCTIGDYCNGYGNCVSGELVDCASLVGSDFDGELLYIKSGDGPPVRIFVDCSRY